MRYATKEKIKILYYAKDFTGALKLLDSALELNRSLVAQGGNAARRAALRVELLTVLRPQVVAEQARFAKPVTFSASIATPRSKREPLWLRRKIEEAEADHAGL